MTTLAILNPIDPGTGSRVQIRVCSSQDTAATGADGQVWWPAISSAPTLSLSLFDGDFTANVEPGSASMALRIDVLRNSGLFPRVERYDWAGAQALLYRLVDGALVDLATMRVERFAMEDFGLGLSLSVDPEPFEADVLFNEYAGTTGIEGGASLKGTPKPWVFGRALNVEPVFIDEIDNVFQVSGYGPVSAIPAIYERGASFGTSAGDFADLAALVAADLAPGQWATCLALGLFRLGAPPAGVITCDVDGDTTVGFLRRTGAIIKEVARRLGLSASINATSFDALDTAVARNVNIVIDQQTSLLDLARRMARACNAVCGIDLDGRLIVSRVAFGSEQFTLDAQGRQMPPVLGMARQNTSPPYRRIVMGANRSWRVHTLDEIAFYSTLTERGAYDALTVYREGDIVVTADGSRWVYINLTATAGNAPPTWPTLSNAHWENLSGPGSGSSDGLNNATITIYQRAASAPALPSLTNTYTFSTGALSALNNGWSQTFPADNGQPLWVSTVFKSSTAATAEILAGEWAAATQLVVSGADGAQGNPGPAINLVANSQAFTFTDNVADPVSQTITIDALLTNITGTVVWSTTPSVTLGGTGNTRTLSLANFGSNRQVVVTATLGGITQTITIFRQERNITAPANANRVPFSRMEGRQGWFTSFSSIPITTATRPVTTAGRTLIRTDGAPTASGQQMFVSQASAQRFAVTAGERLSVTVGAEVQALTGAAPGFWQVYLEYLNAAGTVFTSQEIGSGTGAVVATNRQAAFLTVPTNAVQAQMVMRTDAGGAGTLYSAIVEPMVTSAAVGQTVHPPFTPGLNAEDGSDNTRAVSGPADVLVQFRADLSLTSPLPVTADYQLTAAGLGALTSGVTWAVTVLSGTFASTAPSIVGTGAAQLRINSALTSPEAQLRLTATVGGKAFPPFVVTVRRQIAPPTSAALTFISTSSFAIAHDQPIQVTLPSGVTSVTLTAVADLFIDPATPLGGTTVEGKWQRESSPGTWVDVGAAATSSPNPEVFEVELAPGEVFYTAEPGSITCNRTATGLAGGSVQRFRFVARVSLGNVRLVTFLGNASATA